MLGVSLNQEVPADLRQLAATLLRQYVTKAWQSPEDFPNLKPMVSIQSCLQPAANLA